MMAFTRAKKSDHTHYTPSNTIDVNECPTARQHQHIYCRKKRNPPFPLLSLINIGYFDITIKKKEETIKKENIFVYSSIIYEYIQCTLYYQVFIDIAIEKRFLFFMNAILNVYLLCLVVSHTHCSIDC